MKTVFPTLEIRRLLASVYLALTAGTVLVGAAEQVAGAAAQRAELLLQVPLDWQESSDLFQAWALRFTPAVQPFLKEPDFGRHRVVRGALGWGLRTNEFLSFAWDQTANRLYLDANGNRDLTDDPGASYAGEYDGFLQVFPRVKLNWNTPSGRHRYLVDLRLGGNVAGQLQGNCTLRSFWQGRVELAGRPYQIGIVENPDARTATNEVSYLLFRAWDARTEPIRLNPGTPHLINWSPSVYLVGQGFSIGSHYTNEAGSSRYLVELTPAQTPRGELLTGGKHLYRIVLSQPGGYTVILDRPSPAEKIPVGTYQNAEIWLRQGAAEAFYLGPLRLMVRADASVLLETGGPLTNRVMVERRGDSLVLSYRLADSGRRALTYRLGNEDRNQPPGWTIRMGDKEVASGKFAYG
jgi:hypothetical protein